MNYLLWIVLPNINCCACMVGIVGSIAVGIGYAMTLFCFLSNNEEVPTKTNKTFKTAAIICAALLGIACLTPNKEQLKTLVLVDTISHVKNIKDLPDNTVELLNTFIKSQTDKIKRGKND